MKSVSLLSAEKADLLDGRTRQSENARKIARLLKKRRELVEKEKPKVEIEEKNLRVKENQKEEKEENFNSAATSDEFDDDEPETITENSDSYDSNDEFRVKVLSKDLDKGSYFPSLHKPRQAQPTVSALMGFPQNASPASEPNTSLLFLSSLLSLKIRENRVRTINFCLVF